MSEMTREEAVSVLAALCHHTDIFRVQVCCGNGRPNGENTGEDCCGEPYSADRFYEALAALRQQAGQAEPVAWIEPENIEALVDAARYDDRFAVIVMSVRTMGKTVGLYAAPPRARVTREWKPIADCPLGVEVIAVNANNPDWPQMFVTRIKPELGFEFADRKGVLYSSLTHYCEPLKPPSLGLNVEVES